MHAGARPIGGSAKLSAMSHSTDLTNQFLIAMPALTDPNFRRTVTLICEHNEDGALGIVINRPRPMRLREVFEQLSLDGINEALSETEVLDGGPVQPERGFVLHDGSSAWESTLRVADGLSVTTSRDVLQAMANGDGPAHALVALGYAGWDAGQLETELSNNAWLSVPANRDILFDTPYNRRWEDAARLLGVDLALLSSDVGHA
jgi:putative transcriptional regulator